MIYRHLHTFRDSRRTDRNPKYHTVSGNYKLQTTYCTPDNGPGSTLQILTHGIGFDRSYWDPSFMNGNYSYVDQAVGQGYSTLLVNPISTHSHIRTQYRSRLTCKVPGTVSVLARLVACIMFNDWHTLTYNL